MHLNSRVTSRSPVEERGQDVSALYHEFRLISHRAHLSMSAILQDGLHLFSFSSPVPSTLEVENSSHCGQSPVPHHFLFVPLTWPYPLYIVPTSCNLNHLGGVFFFVDMILTETCTKFFNTLSCFILHWVYSKFNRYVLSVNYRSDREPGIGKYHSKQNRCHLWTHGL